MSARLIASIRASETPGAADRRISERKPCRVSGLLKVNGYEPIRIKTVDMSTTGIAVLLPHALPARTVCEVSFHLHLDGLLRRFAAKVEISNSVFLCSDIRAGCRFLSLDDAAKKTLAAFMR